jgi:UDP-N-acetylglucosamine acyltransferase
MISPLAQIHPKAKISNNVIIEPFCVIYDAEIGEGTHVMPNVTIFGGTKIGKNCKIFPGAIIGAIPQDLKFTGEETTVEIGDNTTIRECVTIHKGTKDKWKTVVGNNCLLMAYAHIAHDCHVGNNVILANSVQLAGHVEVGDYAIIGGLAAANQFTRIGAHTYIGGQSAIRKDVPPYTKAAREPISFMGINIIGLQRRNFSHEQIQTISQIYHILFVENHSTSNAISLIQGQIVNGDLKNEILQFVETSKNGIIKRYSKNGSDDD